MPATERLIVMIDPEVKRRLVEDAKAENVSVAKLARRRLTGSDDPSEKLFLEAVVDLGRRTRAVFAEADARRAREDAADAAQPARDDAIRAMVARAFAALPSTKGPARNEVTTGREVRP